MNSRDKRNGNFSCLLFLSLLVACGLPTRAMPGQSTGADTVNRLADEFVSSYERYFPFTVMYTGLPLQTQSGIDINAPADLARWRRLVHSIEAQLGRISETELVGRLEWITRAYLIQGIREAETGEICRSELWDIYGWVFQLRRIADAQPVGTDEDRREAIERWKHLPGWIDQDAVNLAQGLRAGYSGYRDAVESQIEQIDVLLAAPPEQWPTSALARRANDPEFARQLNWIATGQLRPAAERYRAFLRTEYLPKARVTPSIISQPHGVACLRSRLATSTTVEMDPDTMFDVLVTRRQTERTRILFLAKHAYNVTDLSWEEFSERLRTDPRDNFRDAEDIRSTIERVIARARSVLPQIVTTPPSGDITVKPVPDYLLGSAPAGQFFPGAKDGSRPATFAYRGVPARFHRVVAESLTMHETIPGHYLQVAILAREHATPLHPITQIVLVEGSREGWATYAEGWAAELGLYSSAFDEMGCLVNSVTPSAIADLGMQVKGWSAQQAATYLHGEWPFDQGGQVQGWAAGLASSPASGLEAYPIDGLQYEEVRKRAQDALGRKFNSREYHQMLLSDGALPIWALSSKVDRWIAAHR
jgi:uncharacterized protein (DUF885 family)